MICLASAAPAVGQEAPPAPEAPAAQPNPGEVPPPPPPSPPPLPDPDPELRAEVKALRESAEATKAALDAVSAELGAERDQRAEEVIGLQEKLEKAHAALMAGLRFSGYLQADANAYNQSSRDDINQSNGALLNDERFLIRRARLRGVIDREYLGGVLELDGNTVNGATARLIDAEASAKLPGETKDLPLLMLTVGLFKIPFGYEVVQSDRDRLFMERSTAERGLFPGEFDLGVRLLGGWRFVRYVLAVQNGDPLGERAYPGRDPNSAKDVTGRLGVETPVADGLWIAAGASALSGTGFHPGTPATKSAVQWIDRNQDGFVNPGEIVAVPGMAATPSRSFSRHALGADLRLGLVTAPLGTTLLYGEVYVAQNLDRAILPADPYGPLSRDMREFGGYVGVTQDLGPHLAVGVRYDYYNPDRDSADPAHTLVPTSFAYKTLAAVAGTTWGPVRLTVEYDRNRNSQGRDNAGVPINLKSDTVIARGQVSF